MSIASPQLWVGPECTINRVGDRWRDQAVLSGFRERLDDLDRMASLGARRVRLPVLWEHVESTPDSPDFDWPDRAFARLRELGLPAIVGLLHHGSGPGHTHLLDERFPELFAAYALAVARRYPDQDMWTPINEPLTTARFAALYGLWYPHAEDDAAFVRAVLNQVRATVLAMRAIRSVIPGAALVQTDDVGHTRSTPGLVDQAAFDNERRWLAFDLLCGRVDAHHPLWDWLLACGAGEDELKALRDDPCPPTIVGINAYVTSERFLDERLALHPPALHGGNGRESYVDIESARAHGEPIAGFLGRLREAHERYGLPLAITEVHLGCTREEQLRWLHQAWQAAAQASREGIDVRGVTAWAAFGTMDWNSLLTLEQNHYEPGLWDVRCTPPRLTALGRLARALATAPDARAATLHPVLASSGWWQRALRLRVEPWGTLVAHPLRGRPLLLIGRGPLAAAVERLCDLRGLPCERVTHTTTDIAAAIDLRAPWAVVDACEPGVQDVYQEAIDPDGPAVLGALCAAGGAALLRFAIDGAAVGGDPAHELVVHTSALFGPWDDHHPLARGLAALRAGQAWFAASDQSVTPTYLPDLVQACLDLLVDGETGHWHLDNGMPLPWIDFAHLSAKAAGADTSLVRGFKSAASAAHAPRASGHRVRLLPSLPDALLRYQADRPPAVATPGLRQATAS